MKNTTTYIDNNLNCNNGIINLPKNYEEISFSFSTILSNLHNTILLSHINTHINNDIVLKELLDSTVLNSQHLNKYYNFNISSNYVYYNEAEKINNLMFTIVLIKEILSSHNIKLETTLSIDDIIVDSKIKLSTEQVKNIKNIMKNLEYIITRFRNAIIHNRVNYTDINKDIIYFYDEDPTEKVHYKIEKVYDFIEQFKIYILKLIDRKFNYLNEKYDNLILENYDSSKYITEVTIEIYRVYTNEDKKSKNKLGKHYTQAYIENRSFYKEVKIDNFKNDNLKLTLESIDILLLINQVHRELFKIIDYYKEKSYLDVKLSKILNELRIKIENTILFKKIIELSTNKILYWVINELACEVNKIPKAFNDKIIKTYFLNLYNDKLDICSKIIANSFHCSTVSPVLFNFINKLYIKETINKLELYNILNYNNEFISIIKQVFNDIDICNLILTEHRHEISMIYPIISLYELIKKEDNSFELLKLIKTALYKKNYIFENDMYILTLDFNPSKFNNMYNNPITISKQLINIIKDPSNNNINLQQIRNSMCHNNMSYDYINKNFNFFDLSNNRIAIFNGELFDTYIYEKIHNLFIEMKSLSNNKC